MNPSEPVEPEPYAHGHHESVLRSHSSRTVENSAAYLRSHLRPGMTILDVGCGPGSLTADLAAHAPGSTVTAIDAAADVIDLARETHGDVATFSVGDVYALDAPDDHYDLVHAHQVLQHLTAPVDALREMRRVVRPGGIVAVRDADYGGMTWAPASAGLERWMEIYQSLTARLGHDANAARHLLGWAQQAGFTDVVATSSTWTFADPENREWWARIWADRVVASSFRTHALELGLSTVEELEAIATAWREWATRPDGFFVCPHGELIARAG